MCAQRETSPAGGGRRAGASADPALSLQADLCVMTRLLSYVDPLEPSFVAAVLAIIFNPLFWNVVSTALPAPGLLPIEMASS